MGKCCIRALGMGSPVALRLDLASHATTGARSDMCVWAKLRPARLDFAP